MSEEPTNPETEDVEPAAADVPAEVPKKKSSVTLKMKLALLEVIKRKQFGYEVNFREIALRHNTTSGSLRQTYYRYTHGQITLHEPETAEEKEIETQVQNSKSNHLLRETEKFINDIHEGQLFAAQELAVKGDVEKATELVERILRLRMSLCRCYEANERRLMAVADFVRKKREEQEQERMMSAKTVHAKAREGVAEVDEAEKLRKVFEIPA